MNREEAIELMKHAPSDNRISRVNRGVTRERMTGVINDWLNNIKPGTVLDSLFERRVWQVVNDQKQPQYKLKKPPAKRISLAAARSEAYLQALDDCTKRVLRLDEITPGNVIGIFQNLRLARGDEHAPQGGEG